MTSRFKVKPVPFPQDGGAYFIRSKLAPNLVLDAKGEGKADGTKVIVYNMKKDNNSNQLWSFKDGYIINMHNGLALDFAYSFSNEEVVLKKLQPNAQNQQWVFDGAHIFNCRHDKVLDIAGESKKQGTPVIIYNCHNGLNQQWEIVNVDTINNANK